jgi:ankyrin repeat protein
MLKRLMMIVLCAAAAHVHASEIVHIDKIGQQELTRQLFTAIVQQGSFEEINNLVVDGADINAHDVSGASPCHHAAVFNRDDVVEILCKMVLM